MSELFTFQPLAGKHLCSGSQMSIKKRGHYLDMLAVLCAMLKVSESMAKSGSASRSIFSSEFHL